MLITNSVLLTLNQNLVATYRRSLASTNPWYTKLSTEVPSGTSQNNYGWLGDIPGLREWLGERVVGNLKAYNYAIQNKTWELTLGVRREHIEDDMLGIYDMRATLMGERVAKHPDKLMTNLLRTGHLTNCYDGQYFFDVDHPIVDSTGTTQVASNYQASGFALTQANVLTAKSTMLSWTGDSGDPVAVDPRLLVVPPQLEATARTIAYANLVANTGAGVTNITQGLFDVLVVPELAPDPTTWYLFDASQSVKPFIFQRRTQPNLVSLTNVNDDNVFWKREYIWGVDVRYNAGYGLWQLGFKAAA